MEQPIIKLKTNLVKKYFKEHPECKEVYEQAMKDKYGLWNDKEFTAPFIAVREKKKEEE